MKTIKVKIILFLLVSFTSISFSQTSNIDFENFIIYPVLVGKNTGVIKGKARDSSTRGAYQTIISILHNKYSFSTFSDRNGNFYIGNIPEGNYVVTVYKNGHKLYSQYVMMMKGETKNIDVTLKEEISPQLGYVIGRVVDIHQQSLGNIMVSLSDTNYSRTNIEGIFVCNIVGNELINSYNLKIKKDGFVSYEGIITSVNFQINLIPTIQLQPSYSSFPGEILVSDMKNFRGIKIDRDSKIIQEIRPTGFVHDIQILSDGTTITVCGGDENYGYFLKIITPEGKEERYIDYGIIVAEKLSDGGFLTLNYKNGEIKEIIPNENIEKGFLGLKLLYLKNPSDVKKLSNNNLLVADSGNNRVIEIICKEKELCKIVWEYSENLKFPTSVEKLPNGNVLITDRDNHRVIEVSLERKILFQYKEGLSYPTYSQKLPNGNVLITDTGNNRIIEVAPNNKVAWTSSDSIRLNHPKRARKLF